MTKGANGGILLKRIRMAAVLLTLCLLLPGAGLFASAQNGQITVGVYDYKSESFLVKEQPLSLTGEENTPLWAIRQLSGSDPKIQGGYLKKAFGLGALENGSYSGWVYQINGEFPSRNGSGISAARYQLKPGDRLVWYYAVTKEQAGLGGSTSSTAPTDAEPETAAPSMATPTTAAAQSSVPKTTAETTAAVAAPSITAPETTTAAGSGSTAAAVASETAAQSNTGLSEYREKAAAYLQKNPGSWTAFVLQKQGLSVPAAVSDAVKQEIQELDGHIPPTDYARLIWNGAAFGLNPYEAQGRNLAVGLYNGEIDKQGLNAVAYALLLLHNLPASSQEGEYEWNRERLLKALLAGQQDSGAFALTKDAPPDVDVTAAALCALSYEKSGSEGQKAAERALAWLASVQNPDGTFNSSVAGEGANCESTVQAAIALAMTGKKTDSRFIKNGKTVINAVLNFAAGEGGFSHVLGGEAEPMSTEQALMAMIAWEDGRLYSVPIWAEPEEGFSVGGLLMSLAGVAVLTAIFVFIYRFAVKNRRGIGQKKGHS